MDKAQEKLVRTYFRKRDIASKATHMSAYQYKPYETKYLIANKDKYDIEKMKFSDNTVINDIIKHPEKISDYNFKKNDSRLDYDFDALLEYYPELSKLFTMDALNNYQRADLLKIYPQRITELRDVDLAAIDEYDRVDLIIAQPAFEKYFPMENFEQRNIKKVLAKRPELVRKIDVLDWSYYDIATIIENNPEILKYFNIYGHKETNEIISSVLRHRPELINSFDSNALKNFTTYQINSVISYQPQLIKYFDLSKLDVYSISSLLSKQPGLAKYFDFDKFNSFDKAVLIRSNPEYLPLLDIDNAGSYMLLFILEKQPQLVNKFIGSKDRWGEDKFIGADKDNIKSLLKAQPQLKQYFGKYLKQ